MGGAFSRYRGEERCIQGIETTWKWKDYMKMDLVEVGWGP
jgi:hypothetical protein